MDKLNRQIERELFLTDVQVGSRGLTLSNQIICGDGARHRSELRLHKSTENGVGVKSGM